MANRFEACNTTFCEECAPHAPYGMGMCVKSTNKPLPSRLLKKSLAASFQDGVIAIVEGQLNFQRAVVGELGRS
jgi:hypothetical protein